MDFRRAFEILRKRIWLLVTCVVATALAVWGISYLLPANWQGTVQFYAQIAPAMSTEAEQPAPKPDVEVKSQGTIYESIIKDQDVLQKAAAKAGITESPLLLLKRVEFVSTGPRFYELRVSDTNPNRVVTLTNLIATNFLEKNRQLTTANQQNIVSQLKTESAHMNAIVEQRQRDLEQFSSANGVKGDPSRQLTDALTALELKKNRKQDAVRDLHSAEAQLRSLGDTTKTQKQTPRKRQHIDVHYLETQQEKLDKLEIQLSEAQDKYTESNPIVLHLIDQRNRVKLVVQGLEKRREEEGTDPGASTNVIVPSGPFTVEQLKGQIAGARESANESDRDITRLTRVIESLQRALSPANRKASEFQFAQDQKRLIENRLLGAQSDLEKARHMDTLKQLAIVGPSNPPVNKNAKRLMLLVPISALCAFLLMSMILIGLESWDKRVKSVQEAELMLPMRVVAAIPQFLDEVAVLDWARVTELYPLSAQAESYRFLGQRILTEPKTGPLSIMTLSTKPRQGSTNVICNLAITLAQAGNRVILVDANTRNPSMHKVFSVPNIIGLTDILQNIDSLTLDQAIQATPVKGLSLITSGPPFDNPWELFSSQRLKSLSEYLEQKADYILYDTPSAVTYTDSLNLAAVVDSALFCVRAQEPVTGAERRICEELEHLNVKVLGAVLTDLPQGEPGTASPDRKLMARTPPVPMAAIGSLRSANNPVKRDSTEAASGTEPGSKPVKKRADSHAAQSAKLQDIRHEVQESPVLAGYNLTTIRTDVDHLKQESIEDRINQEIPEDESNPKAPHEIVESIHEENEMSLRETPAAGFPRAISGYAVSAVEDYVGKTNSRVSALLQQVEEETARTTEIQKLSEELALELENTRQRLSESEKRETATAEALKTYETSFEHQQNSLNAERAQIRSKNEKYSADARLEAEALITEERQDAEALVTEARRNAASLVAEARRVADDANSRADQLKLELERALSELNEAKSSQNGFRSSMHLTPDAIAFAEHNRAPLEETLLIERAYAREQTENILLEARRSAEEAGARAAAFYQEHEARVRALGSEAESLVANMRQGVDAHRIRLPEYASAGNSAEVHSAGLSELKPIALGELENIRDHKQDSSPAESTDWRGEAQKNGSDWRKRG